MHLIKNNQRSKCNICAINKKKLEIFSYILAIHLIIMLAYIHTHIWMYFILIKTSNLCSHFNLLLSSHSFIYVHYNPYIHVYTNNCECARVWRSQRYWHWSSIVHFVCDHLLCCHNGHDCTLFI